MPNVAYFVGAGLTKSLETNDRPVPAMWDFTSTMADYLEDAIVLTTIDFGILNWPSSAV